jgi:hypothetical protein
MNVVAGIGDAGSLKVRWPGKLRLTRFKSLRGLRRKTHNDPLHEDNLIVTNCFAAALDSNAARCFRREARHSAPIL